MSATVAMPDRPTAASRDPLLEPFAIKKLRLRNRIVHGYWSIDLEVLHTTAADLLPDFVTQLRAVLAELEGEGS